MLGYYFVKEDNIVKAKKNNKKIELNIITGINQLSKKKIMNIILSMMVFLPKKIIRSYLKTKIKKIEIPAEVTEHINIYSQTIFSSNFSKL